MPRRSEFRTNLFNTRHSLGTRLSISRQTLERNLRDPTSPSKALQIYLAMILAPAGEGYPRVINNLSRHTRS